VPGILTAGAASELLDMRPFKYALLLALFAAVIALDLPRVHAAPSFDCKRASSIAEKEICGLPELEDLDRDIAAAFTQALAVLSAADADALRADQRAWLKTRDDCGDLIHGNPPIYADVFACLREQMTARAAKLRAIVTAKQFSR
jgi:uncharacterized protein YecT (DUF1311 family)